MKRKKILIIVLSLLIAGCAAQSPDKLAFQNISVEEYKEMSLDPDTIFINTHIPLAGNIPGTNFEIPFDDIESNLSLLPQDKNTEIVVYCRSGNMSVTASETLISMGYTNIYNLVGGTNAWEDDGNILEK